MSLVFKINLIYNKQNHAWVYGIPMTIMTIFKEGMDKRVHYEIYLGEFFLTFGIPSKSKSLILTRKIVATDKTHKYFRCFFPTQISQAWNMVPTKKYTLILTASSMGNREAALTSNSLKCRLNLHVRTEE